MTPSASLPSHETIMTAATKRYQEIQSLKRRIAERRQRRENTDDLYGRLVAKVAQQLRSEIRAERKQGRVA